ncbi:MAG: hypothetical protein U0Q16_18310 [Bryobacteraceae bacterium]
MAFPHFDPHRPSVLFFTRGRGRGHAIPDLEIARQIHALRPEVQIHFVSYGTGAATLTANGQNLIDLDMPDDNSTAATIVQAGRLIGALRPQLVVAHEEYAALPAAGIFGVPAILLTDFFSEGGSFWMECQWFAERILFLDRKGLHPEPPSAKGRTTYLGPVMRSMEPAAKAGASPSAGPTIGVMPGSWTEARAPLVDRVLAALDPRHHLIWLAGVDADLIRRATRHRPNTTVLEAEWRIERVMRACDLVITKCNRMTVRELAALGIRTLSVTYGLNPADDRSIAGLPSNQIIALRQLTRGLIRGALEAPAPKPVRFRSRSAAVEILRYLPGASG